MALPLTTNRWGSAEVANIWCAVWIRKMSEITGWPTGRLDRERRSAGSGVQEAAHGHDRSHVDRRRRGEPGPGRDVRNQPSHRGCGRVQERHLRVPPAAVRQTLIEVLAVRLGEALAPQSPPADRDAG